MKRAAMQLLFFVPFALSCRVEYGSTKITDTIDPNLPREDPASYPDYPIVSVPPGIPCPSDAMSDCPDASWPDAGFADAPTGDTSEDGGA